MDPLQLLADLEGLRNKIPGFLQNDFENLIASIRNIYEMSIKAITPSQPVHDGKHSLVYHQTNLSNLYTKLNNNLTPFQQIYTGQGSDAYYTTAMTSAQNLQLVNNHLADAAQFHDTMATNFDLATEAQIALVSLLVGLGITLGVLVFSAGTTAPATVPAAILEAGGGAVSIGLLTDAEAAALTAVMSLLWTTLPSTLLYAVGVDLTINSILNPPQTTSIDLGSTGSQAQASTITIDLGINSSTWNPGERQAIADDLVTKAKAARQAAIDAYDAAHPDAKTRDPKEDPSKAVGAMAVLAIYGSDGTLIFEDTDFELGFNGADPSDHAEALLVQWAEGVLAGMSSQLVGTIINMLIYVQKVPCAASCRPAIQEDTWLEDLYHSTGLPAGAATVNLIVFSGGMGVPGAGSFYFKSTRG